MLKNHNSEDHQHNKASAMGATVPEPDLIAGHRSEIAKGKVWDGRWA